jgi:hypothetical protein
LIAAFRAAVVDGVVLPLTKDACERRTELVQCIRLLLSGFNDMTRSAIKSTGEDPSQTLFGGVDVQMNLMTAKVYGVGCGDVAGDLDDTRIPGT